MYFQNHLVFLSICYYKDVLKGRFRTAQSKAKQNEADQIPCQRQFDFRLSKWSHAWTERALRGNHNPHTSICTRHL
jgi:hypothetical protein